ncbi:MAG TPA: hypothetical protein VH253_15605 [Phycisphaerae bacterium]|nr:hypothetical protein [Phycisphaerae bacterium]
MMRRTIFLAVIAAAVARAQGGGPTPATPPAAQSARETAAFLSPYTDSQTLLVAHADLARVDSQALFQFIDQLLAQTPDSQDERKSLPMAQTAFDLFLVRIKQIGIRQVYVIADQTDLTTSAIGGAALGGAILAPLPPGTDAAPVIALYQAMGLDKSMGVKEPTILPGNVIALGGPEVIARLRQRSDSPVGIETLAAAFSGSDDAALQIAGLLSSDTRRVLAQMPFDLPPELGGRSIRDYSEGLEAVAASLTLPPRPRITVVLAAHDAPAAARLAGAFNALFRDIPTTPWFTTDLHTDPPQTRELLGKLLAGLTFTPTGTTATLRIEGSELTSFASALLLPDLHAAGEQAARVKSASQMRQVMMACYQYAQNHGGDFPPTLQTLLTDHILTAQALLSSPRALRDKTLGYHPWTAAQLKKLDVAQTPTIWEHPDTPDAGLTVAYADGHVEFVRLQKNLDDELQAAEKKLQP